MQQLNFSNAHKTYCWQLFSSCTANYTKTYSSEVDLCDESCINFHSICINKSRLCPKAIDQELPTILLVTYIAISISSLLANGFVCAVYMLSNEMRTAKHYFIVNLAIADILIAVFGIPLHLTRFIENETKTLCQIGAMIDVLCCTSSIVGFTVISIERFVAVKYPLRYSAIVSRKRCLVVLCSAWGYSIANALASQIFPGKRAKNRCIFFSDDYIIFTTVTSFLLPLLVMILIYGWIYRVAKYQARQIYNRARCLNNQIKQEFKAAKTLTLIIGAFVVSWLPLFCYNWLFGEFGLLEEKPPFKEFHHLVEIVRYLNGLANPFIYVGINREFRHSTMKILKRILRAEERNGEETSTVSSRATQVYRLRNIYSEESTAEPC